MAESASADPVARYAIGALLAVPVQVLPERVAAALVEDFPDYRRNCDAVFRWLGPEGDRISDIAARCGVSKQAMGETITWLEQHGYVERLPDPSDGRATLVRRTELVWHGNPLAPEQVEATTAMWRGCPTQARAAPPWSGEPNSAGTSTASPGNRSRRRRPSGCAPWAK